ncbi:MAG: hypothetical protein NT121_23140 [Chloroflexi bacterium]|nr:hypothetical protein [Chloroflexota bacterium]
MIGRKLVISCHADTGFESHSLQRSDGGVVYGELDNFIGVFAVMRAYFSGRLNQPYLQLALTHGEEEDFAGTFEELNGLNKRDVVLVVGYRKPVG